MTPASRVPIRPALLLTLAGIMAALMVGDRFLARAEQTEVAHEARDLFEQGQRLIAAKQATQAIPALQRAHALVRTDHRYELALSHALLDAGRLSDAEASLDQLLDRDPNDGETNLLMARLLTRRGNRVDASAYYHRALYGKWPPGTDRTQVRMELIEMLAAGGNSQELLSELISFHAQAPEAAQEHIAELFRSAGSPSRAAEIYRTIIRRDPRDARAYQGLSRAQLDLGDFRPAQISLLNALRLNPNDPSIAGQLQLTSALSALDPTLRRLSSSEKYARARRLLSLALDAARECVTGKSYPALEQAMAAADTELNRKSRGPMNNELSEALLDQAERLWNMRQQQCPADSNPADPLPFLMRKMAAIGAH